MSRDADTAETTQALDGLRQQLAGAWRHEAMRRISHAVGSRHEAGDIFDSFYLEGVPNVARHITDGHIQDERSYVMASLANHARRFVQQQRRYEDALRNLDEEVFVSETPAPDEPAPATSPPITEAILSQVEPRRAEAVRLFLGVGANEGRGMSVNEIAERLGWTRWSTRAAVVDGLLSVAIALGVHGNLSPREVEACRLVLLEGIATDAAARALALSRAELTGALHRAREIVGGTLRSMSPPGVKPDREDVG